jgi:hypothetical protein
MQQTIKPVLFVTQNIKDCKCPMCPVQSDSRCVKDETPKLQAAIKSGKPARPDEIPVVYCNSGHATCNDLELDRSCICPTCPVYKEYGLSRSKPVMHFCRDGRPA